MSTLSEKWAQTDLDAERLAHGATRLELDETKKRLATVEGALLVQTQHITRTEATLKATRQELAETMAALKLARKGN
jgi:hypothetical protein